VLKGLRALQEESEPDILEVLVEVFLEVAQTAALKLEFSCNAVCAKTLASAQEVGAGRGPELPRPGLCARRLLAYLLEVAPDVVRFEGTVRELEEVYRVIREEEFDQDVSVTGAIHP
jgi:hypothetical protein